MFYIIDPIGLSEQGTCLTIKPHVRLFAMRGVVVRAPFSVISFRRTSYSNCGSGFLVDAGLQVPASYFGSCEQYPFSLEGFAGLSKLYHYDCVNCRCTCEFSLEPPHLVHL